MKKKIDPLLIAKGYNSRNTLRTNEALFQFAKEFLSNKIDVLQKDIDHCLVAPYAPFPAIIFCLSTIDLLAYLELFIQERQLLNQIVSVKHQAKNYG
jgi:hypothetical protein